MAMLPVSYVVKSQCPSCRAFGSSKTFPAKCSGYANRVLFDSQKLDLKQKSFITFSHRHYSLRALATSSVSPVRTLEKTATYLFWTETGGQLKVLVGKKNDNKYGLFVEALSFQLFEREGELIMIWGLFRSDSTNYMQLGVQQSSADNLQNTVETPFMKGPDGRLSVELDFDSNLAPFYVSIVLKSQFGSEATIRSHRKTNFVVPVGFGSGRPSPLGISFSDDGSINFAFVSRNVESVVLCLYTDDETEKPAVEIDLDPYVNRTGDVWHALVDGSVPFVSYGYRCRSSSGKGGEHFLLDPYAKAVEGCLGKLSREAAFDWSGELRPSVEMEKLIIYRLNVTRFTKDGSKKLQGDICGSFSGVSEKLRHLKDLGINAILLEPIFPYDEGRGPYFPLHFFSPGNYHRSSGDPKSVAISLKDMVKELHCSGIEVMLEVVFTHTGEFGAQREIYDSSYYHVKRGDASKSRNALNCNNPVVQQMILESLRHWVVEYHIDGFCFIHAASLTRGVHGEFLSRPPLVEAIAFDPLLAKVKIIADSWDPNDMNTESILFPHWKRWAEMNAKFCIDVRNFLRGQGPISNLATRLCGSGDLFSGGRGPGFSFNFITRSAGFTLLDLVSFSSKEVASELSWNCGGEGPTNKAEVLERRLKQIRNFLFILFISLGVPVLNMGDECGYSTGGSNAYVDRKALDWNALRSGFGMQVTQFISFLSSLRTKRGDLLQRKRFLIEDNIEWHGADGSPPKWDDPSCKFLAMTLKVDSKLDQSTSETLNVGGDLFIAFNNGGHEVKVGLPPAAGDENWVCLVDTALPFPGFFHFDGVPQAPGAVTYEMKSHSCILFEARSL